MAALLILLEVERNRRMRRERVFRDRTNPLDVYNDIDLINRYRLPRRLILKISDETRVDLEHPTNRSRAMPVTLQILTALRFYATGTFQSVAGDVHGISKASVSRCVYRVSKSICFRLRNEMKFPSTDEERRSVIDGFYKIAEFPNVLGVVDGTQIPIKAPSSDEHLFVCRKGYHSINVQGICDAELRITNIVVKWPGNTHDAFIWSNSGIAEEIQRMGGMTGWILGDSGYPLRPWLLTPKLNAATAGDHRYNRKLKVTRCTIERCFGVWKARFRCLHKSGGVLMYSPERCVNIVKATALLHNMCIANHLNMQGLDLPDDYEDEQQELYQGPHDNDGVRARDNLILRRFTQ